MADNSNMVSLSSEIIETVIGAQTKFKGNVRTEKPIRIDGYFEGDIDSNNLVVVSECGTVKGNIKCAELQLKGTGEGTAQCSSLMQFAETGRFAGDITVRSLITVAGSMLNGKIEMVNPDAPAAQPAEEPKRPRITTDEISFANPYNK